MPPVIKDKVSAYSVSIGVIVMLVLTIISLYSSQSKGDIGEIKEEMKVARVERAQTAQNVAVLQEQYKTIIGKLDDIAETIKESK